VLRDEVAELPDDPAALGGVIRGQGPRSNAARAAATARSMSRSSPLATVALGSSVAGLIV